jgi:hypothetical protein
MMNTNVKMILTAVGIAVLASPVMAASSHHHAAPSAISSTYGSATGARTAPVEGNPFHIDDTVHVAFPQRDSSF